jgi:hypothetical protein
MTNIGDCPSAARRAGLTDDEFWIDIGKSLLAAYGMGSIGEDMDCDLPLDSDDSGTPETPCSICGAAGECGVDIEGRPMIHIEPYEEEQEDSSTTDSNWGRTR